MNLADDDFTLLGLPQQYYLDSVQLQTQWKRAMQAAHPDRFSQAGAAGQRLAMQWSVRLNEAYQRLKNPLKRAEYLCGLRGVKIDAERNTAMPAAFLMQQMEWREALADARNPADKERIHAELKAQAASYQAQITQALDAPINPQAADQNAPNPFVEQAAQRVRAWMFVDKLLKTL